MVGRLSRRTLPCRPSVKVDPVNRATQLSADIPRVFPSQAARFSIYLSICKVVRNQMPGEGMGLVVGWARRRMGGAGWLREMARAPKVAGRWMGQQMVGEVARGLSLFGGASSEVRRCNCSVVD